MLCKAKSKFRHLKNYNMLNLDKSKKYLLACSFGPDSMALFDMLLKEHYSFEVAHVNYHLREESDYEERSLREYCKKNKIIIHVLDNSKSIERNVEATCREIRYSFFSKLYSDLNFDALLVAHNQDDEIETYLLQKKRKNLVIHYGLAEKTNIKGMNVYRPLLSYTKQELLSYCDKLSIPYSIDKTNLLPIYERNKIRINFVSRLNPIQRKEILEEIEDENQKLKVKLDKIKRISNSIVDLKNLSNDELAYYLNEKLKELEINKPVTYKQSLEVKKFFDSKKSNITLVVARNSAAITKAYDQLIIEKCQESFDPILVNEPKLIENDLFLFDLINEGSKRNIKNEDYPITIRPYLDGDKYMISNYEVSVRRLFIDWKMPTSLRKRWPIFVNKDNKIVYIPRYRKDFNIENSPKFYVKERFTLK